MVTLKSKLIGSMVFLASILPIYSYANPAVDKEKPKVENENSKEDKKNTKINALYQAPRNVNQSLSDSDLGIKILEQLGSAWKEYQLNRSEEKEEYTYDIERLVEEGIEVPITKKTYFNIDFEEVYGEIERKGKTVDSRIRIEYEEDKIHKGVRVGLGFSFMHGASKNNRENKDKSHSK